LQRQRLVGEIYEAIDEWLAPALARWIAVNHSTATTQAQAVRTDDKIRK
jgi:hypothetical protein